VNLFELRDFICDEYREFSTGYTKIRAEDIKRFIAQEHENQRYWPPLSYR